MTAEDVIEQVETDYLGRLKWLVLREFGVLPGSREAKELGDEDFLICGAHMLIDQRMRSESSGNEFVRNVTFDENRFYELSGGKSE